MRHAEKVSDGSSDPVLNAESEIRANELKRVLLDVGVDEIFSIPFNRTRLTVVPLAKALGLEVQEYNPFDLKSTVEMIKNSKGKTLVLSGHSNTTPVLVNLLLGGRKI